MNAEGGSRSRQMITRNAQGFFRLWHLHAASMLLLVLCLLLTTFSGWGALHGLLLMALLTDQNTLKRLTALTWLIGLCCWVAFFAEALRKRLNIPLLFECVATALLLIVLRSPNVLESQRTAFLRGVAEKVRRPDVLRDLTSWEQSSVADFRENGITQTQLTKTNLPSRLRMLFPERDFHTNVGIENDRGETEAWALIVFSERAARWGIRTGSTNVTFGWRDEATYPVTNDIRVFFGVVRK